MPQDPLERVKTLLFAKRSNPLALLLDLTSMLPESLLNRAIWLAQNASEEALRAFLVNALAKRLPAKVERVELKKKYPMPAGVVIKEVSIPEGKEVKRLIARLPEEQRDEVLGEWFDKIETGRKSARRSKPPAPRIEEGWTLDLPLTGVSPAVLEPLDISRSDESVDRSSSSTASIFGPVDVSGKPIRNRGAAASMIRIPPKRAFDDEAEETSRGIEERADIVNLGFAHANAADMRLQADEPLQTGHSYYFWLNIGRELEDAIGSPTPIDLEKLPEEAVLTVAIFGFEKELGITRGHDVGELKIQKDSTVKVLRKATGKKSIPLSPDAAKDFLKDFLLFPVSVPEKEGTYRLRCNIYCSQVLVQSYVISATAKKNAMPVAEACSKKLDYVLSQSLRAGHLASLTKEPHLLSLMVNNNGDGTHSFRFFGADGAERYKDDAQVDGLELGDFLAQARGALHRVSWGDSEPWDPGKKLAYRYQEPEFDSAKLALDLAYLARAGWRIYTGFVSHLNKTAAELESLLANPGLLQIALKLSPRAVLPAAVVYDYPWKPERFADNFETTPFELCPTFAAAIEQAQAGGPPLEECDCFKGGCALKAMIADIRKPGSKKTLNSLPPIICPSGFWGYRHFLGLPLTLDGTNKDMPPVITFKDELQMVACVSTDRNFVKRDPHLGRLKGLKANLKFERDEDYDSVVIRLRETAPHLLYFYCHGGIRKNNHPYLEIGKNDQIAPDNLFGEGIQWKGPNPLVFINGCHTTSLNPEITLDFVSSFVQQNGAAGVVGTEITIFEPLAVQFAEECLSRFIGAAPHNESMPLGRAVRGARLELLKQGNPLGLVYIPYAVGTLRLQQPQN